MFLQELAAQDHRLQGAGRDGEGSGEGSEKGREGKLKGETGGKTLSLLRTRSAALYSCEEGLLPSYLYISGEYLVVFGGDKPESRSVWF